MNAVISLIAEILGFTVIPLILILLSVVMANKAFRAQGKDTELDLRAPLIVTVMVFSFSYVSAREFAQYLMYASEALFIGSFLFWMISLAKSRNRG